MAAEQRRQLAASRANPPPFPTNPGDANTSRACGRASWLASLPSTFQQQMTFSRGKSTCRLRGWRNFRAGSDSQQGIR